MKSIQPFNFFYYAFIIDKQLLRQVRYYAKLPFYEYVCGLIFEHTKEKLLNAKITVDKSGGQDFEKWFSSYIKKGMNTDKFQRVRKVIMADSARENLLQLADFVVGIIHRDYDPQKFLKVDYLKMIQHKCIKTVIRPIKT